MHALLSIGRIKALYP